MSSTGDDERNRLSGRLARYARVGSGVGGLAARMIGARAAGRDFGRDEQAVELARLLGGLKGPLMKVAQLARDRPGRAAAGISPSSCRSCRPTAPPMGWAFVRRRMRAELGPEWENRFASFEHEPAAAASLGQVHRAVALDGTPLACKLQYPDMESAVEADLAQLGVILAVQRRFSPRSTRARS